MKPFRPNHLVNFFNTDDLCFVCADRAVRDHIEQSNFPVQDPFHGKRHHSAYVCLLNRFEEGDCFFSHLDEGVQCLFLPQYFFEASREVAIYNFHRLLETNFNQSLRDRAVWYHRFAEKETLNFRLMGHELECRLVRPVSLDLMPDRPDHLAAARILEVGLEQQTGDKGPAFYLNGTMPVKGLTLGRTQAVPIEWYIQGRAMLESVARCEKAYCVIKDNRLVSFRVGEVDLARPLIQLAGFDRETAREFSVGLNQGIREHVDFSCNSQLNEGIQGLHIGYGDGKTGLHIDLIAPGARYLSSI